MYLLTFIALAMVLMLINPRPRILLATFLAAAFAFSPAVANAQGLDPSDSVGEIRLSAFTVSIVISAFLPIVTAIVTKLSTSTKVKGFVTLAANFIATSLVGWQVAGGDAVFTAETLATALLGFVISTAMYLGFYKDVDINAKLLPDKGI